MIHRCEMFPDDDIWDAAAAEDRLPHWPAMGFHLQAQDTSLPGWAALLQLVEDAARDRREMFAPKRELGPDLWAQVITLPASIASLTHVRKLNLYGSDLLRLPPEIGRMERLEEFTPYTSYGLHWFPYEITRCRQLRDSTVSTRALYGNFKFRHPFPSLDPPVVELVPKCCSVCDGPLDAGRVEQRWISLRVATDTLPLLVNACSLECIERLPPPAAGYVPFPHKGGLTVVQPAAEW
jgi:hypothetical protein